MHIIVTIESFRFNKLMRNSLIIIFSLVVLMSCKITSKSTLNLKVFLKEGKENAIYPSIKQIKMLEVFIPDEIYKPSLSTLQDE